MTNDFQRPIDVGLRGERSRRTRVGEHGGDDGAADGTALFEWKRIENGSRCCRGVGITSKGGEVHGLGCMSKQGVV